MPELLFEKRGTTLLPAASSGVPAPIVIYGLHDAIDTYFAPEERTFVMR